ncbi:MAG: hypothetical protein ABL998_10655 [Planctomycetota bacterium]
MITLSSLVAALSLCSPQEPRPACSFEIFDLEGTPCVLSLEGLGSQSPKWRAFDANSANVEIFTIGVPKSTYEYPKGSRASFVSLSGQRFLAAFDGIGSSLGTRFALGRREDAESGVEFVMSKKRLELVAWREGEVWMHGTDLIRPSLFWMEDSLRMMVCHSNGNTVFLSDPGAIGSFLELGIDPNEAEIRTATIQHHDEEDAKSGDYCIAGQVIVKGSNPRGCVIGRELFVAVEDLDVLTEPSTVSIYSGTGAAPWASISLPDNLVRPWNEWNIAAGQNGLLFLGATSDGVDLSCQVWEFSISNREWQEVVPLVVLPQAVRARAHWTRGQGTPSIMFRRADGVLETK